MSINNHLDIIYDSLNQINERLNITNLNSNRDILRNRRYGYDDYVTREYNRNYDMPRNHIPRNHIPSRNERIRNNTFSQQEYSPQSQSRYNLPTETQEIHFTLNEPIGINEMPNYLSTLFSHAFRQNENENENENMNEHEIENTNIKLVNDNTEVCLHTDETPINCTICREDINRENGIMRKITHCGHVFHQKCLDKWFETHKTCPICRHVLTPSVVNDLD